MTEIIFCIEKYIKIIILGRYLQSMIMNDIFLEDNFEPFCKMN